MKNWLARLWFSSARPKAVSRHRFVPLLEPLENRLAPATITVTTTADETVTNDAPSVSLREAIISINNGADTGADVTANRVGGYGVNDTINFNIPGAGVQTLSLGSSLPTIIKPLTINGYTQGVASLNTLANGDNAVILIQIDGTNAGTAVNGLTLGAGSAGSTIQGLDITNFQADANLNGGVGILVQSNTNQISGNFIGVNPAGTTQMANGGDGIRIFDASGTQIGGTIPGVRNVVSGNGIDGIHIVGTLAAPATNNTVQGNFVGVAADGKSSLIATTGGPQPESITLGADGNLWFTEGNNNAIGRITPAGVVTVFSLAALQANSNPTDIVSDPANHLLYFTENGVGRIGSINPLAGNSAAILASETQSATVPSGAAAQPYGITLGPDGKLWFTELNHRVSNITPNLATINEFSTGITPGALPSNIVSGADGALWFTEITNNAVGRITTAGAVTEFSLAGLQAFSQPFDIVSDPANHLLYFTENYVGRIGRINPLAGNSAAILASETQSAAVPAGANAGLIGITLGPDGNLWFAEPGPSQIAKITPNLATINEFSTGITPGAQPFDIVTGPDGALWFTESAAGRIGRITTAGSVSEFSILPNSTGARGNNYFGIEISGGNTNTIGGTVAGARNVVGFNYDGIELDNGAQFNSIQGNFVGVGADGVTPASNLLHGIVLRSSNGLAAPFGPAQANEPGTSFNTIGGTQAGAGNLVEFNGASGVAVFGNPVSASNQPNVGNSILGNSIFQNARSNPGTAIGIDLTNTFPYPKHDGITPNDSKGHGAANNPNNFQNFPVITAATSANGKTTITGTLTQSISPNTTFRIEFFASNPDPLGAAPQGQTFLGFATVTTDGSGNVSFSITLNVSLANGQIVTATATDPSFNTSEFSAGVTVKPPVPPTPPPSPRRRGRN